jgi:GNAT superfamily N-acetyltransferase
MNSPDRSRDAPDEDAEQPVTEGVRLGTTADADGISTLLAELGYSVTSQQVAFELENQPDTVVLVFERAGALTGLAAVNTRRQLHEAAPVTTIDALVVAERSRSQGIGEALIGAAEALARDRGACMLDLHSGLQRVDARRFYERVGLKVIGNHFIKHLEPR